ncbi:MAG: hypothetical protein GF411_13865 [Candidatus Lokiarchaeota archaeon]|nr:hypothetical protein [Candidatus Lokiarchaeota archaeon]
MPKININNRPSSFDIKRPLNKSIKMAMGLDLGTTTGYAYTFIDSENHAETDNIVMGQWDLSAGPYDSGAIRFLRLRQFLTMSSPDYLFFEDVRYTPEKPNKFLASAIISRAANVSELFGAFKATLCTWAEEHDIPCEGFGIGQIKKHATGKGNANKIDMINACNEKFNTDFDYDYESTGVDNIADAMFVLSLGISRYIEGM